MPTTARTSRWPTPATSSLWRASRTPPPATRCARPTRRSSSSGWSSRIRSSRSRSSPRPRPTRRRWASRSIASPARTRRSASRPTMNRGQTIIKGMGELHLEILVDRMKREFKVEANVGAPQVAYREYLAKPVELTYTHKKQSGGSGQFGEIKVSVTPGERGSGFVFIDEIKGGNVPQGIYSVGREGHARDRRDRLADRLPDHRLRGRADRRQVPRRRLVGAGVRDRAAAARCAKRPRRPASSCSSRS